MKTTRKTNANLTKYSIIIVLVYNVVYYFSILLMLWDRNCAMLAALLEQMKKMNENILSISAPVDLKTISSNDSNNGESLEERVANLTANSMSQTFSLT